MAKGRTHSDLEYGDLKETITEVIEKLLHENE